jgi:hypothetical protein
MSKYIEQAHWVNFDSAVNRFADFIKRAGPIGDYHVVFSMGTTVRIDPHADLIEFVEYTGEYVENYPVAQISEDIDDIIANNIIAWEIQKNIPSYGRIIRSAYHFLISPDTYL